MDGWNKILSIIERAKVLGERSLSNGTRLVGHVPHVAPEAWLHQVFASLSERDVIQLERKTSRQIPAQFRDFLKIANGLSLFSGSLSIYGLRTSFARTGDAAWQPFCIVTSNTIERPKDAEESCFFIGGYKRDGSHLFIDGKTSKVFRSERRTAKAVNEWNSLEEMLVTETIRIALLFDDVGRRINPQEPTTPNYSFTKP